MKVYIGFAPLYFISFTFRDSTRINTSSAELNKGVCEEKNKEIIEKEKKKQRE